MEAVPLGPTEHLLYKATLPRLGDRAALPNSQKQTKEGSQNEETKEHVPNERTEDQKKELNKMEISNIPDSEFKTLVIRILNELRRSIDELSENFNKDIGHIKMEI